jgi:hypothetical protein
MEQQKSRYSGLTASENIEIIKAAILVEDLFIDVKTKDAADELIISAISDLQSFYTHGNDNSFVEPEPMASIKERSKQFLETQHQIDRVKH